jgi:hypothetical protein
MCHIRSVLYVGLIAILPALTGCEMTNSSNSAGSAVNCANQQKGKTAAMPLECPGSSAK